MRLGLVSATYPFGAKEPYLDVELRELAPALDALLVYPAAPQSRRRGFDDVPGDVAGIGLFAPRTLALALRAALSHPRRVLGVLHALLTDRYPPRVKLKNLAVVPKGLALATLARARRLDHLHAYWLSTPATVAWIAGRIAGIPFSATAHRWDVYENNMAARKVREAAFVRTISERGRRDLLARTDGDPANVHVVRLGVALPDEPVAGGAASASRAARSHALAQEPNAIAPLRILCAAALVPVKDHRTLLEALRLLREDGVAFACTLAGEGPLRDDIAREIARLGLDDAVIPAGRIPHDELLAALASGRYDVSVIASAEHAGGLMEGVPVALIEAMAAGCAVVATSSGSVGELVDGETGLLVPHSDPRALAEALGTVARDPALAERLREAGRARVRADYDVRRTVSAWRALFAGATPG
ncbi:MAG TPA: glycosyltransferase [Candidatus Baltobacteraceae bacterium]|nr:glycosyltransferase [Candidatus Baltobacteraceae bacterium]